MTIDNTVRPAAAPSAASAPAEGRAAAPAAPRAPSSIDTGRPSQASGIDQSEAPRAPAPSVPVVPTGLDAGSAHEDEGLLNLLDIVESVDSGEAEDFRARYEDIATRRQTARDTLEPAQFRAALTGFNSEMIDLQAEILRLLQDTAPDRVPAGLASYAAPPENPRERAEAADRAPPPPPPPEPLAAVPAPDPAPAANPEPSAPRNTPQVILDELEQPSNWRNGVRYNLR